LPPWVINRKNDAVPSLVLDALMLTGRVVVQVGRGEKPDR
jgi:hypothetical protein